MTSPTTPPSINLDEYRCQPMMRFPMGNAVELLYFPLKKEAKLVSPPEVRLLTACGQFATLEGHVSWRFSRRSRPAT